MRASTIALLIVLLSPSLLAQEKPVQLSEHGWYLSPHGNIRVLVIFAEIEYDKDRSKDPQSEGAAHWPKGQLPKWSDELFDPHPSPVPKATVSRYYHDISMGQYTVLGDYMDRLITLKESEHSGLQNGHGINRLVLNEANELGALRTKNGLSVADFDLWKRGGKPGMPKELGPDDPHSYDHVMVILRNSTLTHGQGSVDPGSSGKLFGYDSDSQSRFGAMNGLPFEILKHEFNHLFLGGNNFHSGGGNAAQFQSFFICLQGGFSMMGAASSSLLTCAAWDRDRLGWIPEGAQHRIRARDRAGSEIDADIDPVAGDTGLFVLRDFVTTGDALRIRMPFLPEAGYQQWLWVENHLGHQRNGSPTDRFHWELEDPCVAPMEPGLFMTMQVDREDREGSNIFGGQADYLRPLPANGNYDFSLRGDTLNGSCPFGGTTFPFHMEDRWANPLTGNHELELPVYDRNADGRLQRSEHYVPRARVRKGRIEADGVFYGRPEHAFRLNGNRKLGIATNPSSANMMTLVSAGTNDTYKRGVPNVRTVYLNGISVELVDMAPNGDATVRVRNDDAVIDRDVRWCADSIVLPPLRGVNGTTLLLSPRRTILLDRSRTPTRIGDPEQEGRTAWFSDPTSFTLSDGARMELGSKSTVELRNGSVLHLLPGSHLVLGAKARIVADGTSRIIIHPGGRLDATPKQLKKLSRSGRLEQR
jgi:hypothetical protein